MHSNAHTHRMEPWMSGMSARGRGEGRGQGRGQGKGQEEGRGQGRGQERGQGKGQEEGRGKGQEEGSGRGKGSGQEEGRGQGRGQGKGRGEGRGRGQGKGHGRGQGHGRGEERGRGGGQGKGRGRGQGHGCGPGHDPGRGCGGGDHHHPHGGFPPWFRDFMGRPARAGRGEVKYLILEAIKEKPRHGYEIIQYIEERSQGAYRPSAGTVYPTLQLLEETDLATAEEKDGRKCYAITDAGREELDANEDDVEDAYARLSHHAGADAVPDLHRFAKKMRRLGRTMRRAFHRGRLSSDQFDEIMKVLEDAANRIQHIVTKK